MKHKTIIDIENSLTEPERLEKFTKVAKMVHGCSDEMAQTIVLAELQIYCNRLSAIDLNKHQLTFERGKAIFLEVIMAGLSFSPDANHVYVQPSFTNSSILTYYISPYGKLFLCQNAGSVDHVTQPVIVYEGDTFRVGTNERGHQIVLHSALQHPEKKPPVIAGYVFVVTPKGDREPYWMDKADVERLKAKSRGNKLYVAQNGDIDSGFFGGKLIRHSLKTYRTKSIIALPEEDGTDDIPVSIEAPQQFQPSAVPSTLTNDQAGRNLAQEIMRNNTQPPPPPQTYPEPLDYSPTPSTVTPPSGFQFNAPPPPNLAF